MCREVESIASKLAYDAVMKKKENKVPAVPCTVSLQAT
jgi:hypothetical protein